MNGASASGTSRMMITTTGSGFQNCPVSPGMNISGTNATTFVRMLKTTGPLISRAPRIAAATGLMPACRYSWTFSPTTTASSTTIPSTIRKPTRLIMLMLSPATGMNSSPPMNEIAIPIITQNASRSSRNRARISRTITTANTPFSTTSVSRRRKSSAASESVRHVAPGGSACSKSASVASTASATSSGDCSPTRYTSSSTDGDWLNCDGKSSCAKPSRTSAMSPSVTTAPDSSATTSTSSNCSAHCLRALTRSRISPLLVSTAPAATSLLAASILRATSPSVSPYSRRRSRGISTCVT